MTKGFAKRALLVMIISIVGQFMLRHSGEDPAATLALGVFSGVLSIAVLLFLEWVAA